MARKYNELNMIKPFVPAHDMLGPGVYMTPKRKQFRWDYKDERYVAISPNARATQTPKRIPLRLVSALSRPTQMPSTRLKRYGFHRQVAMKSIYMIPLARKDPIIKRSTSSSSIRVATLQ